MTRRTLFFDLDGTLTDSEPGIANAVRHALRQLGVDDVAPGVLRSFIGPPLVDSFRYTLGFSEADARRAVAAYREYYREQGLFENIVYEGVPAMLDALADAGHALYVATSKPEPFAVRILAHFGLDARLTGVAGADFEGLRAHKPQVIRHALERFNLAPGNVTMIGDREYDILGARENGLDAVGVLYGYGTKEELLAAGAPRLADTVTELKALLLGR